MVYNKDILNGIRQIIKKKTRRVYLPDDSALHVAYIGNCRLDNGDTFKWCPMHTRV